MKDNKQGFTWFPNTWWASEARQKLRGKPTETLLFREVIDKLYMEGGRWEGTLQGCRSLLLGMRLTVAQRLTVMALFTVSDAGIWSHRKVDEQLKRSRNGAENVKKRYDGSSSASTDASSSASSSGTTKEIEKKRKEKEISTTSFFLADAVPGVIEEKCSELTALIGESFIRELVIWDKTIEWFKLEPKERQKLCAAVFCFLDWLDDEHKLKGRPRKDVTAHFTSWYKKQDKLLSDPDWVETKFDEYTRSINQAKRAYGKN